MPELDVLNLPYRGPSPRIQRQSLVAIVRSQLSSLRRRNKSLKTLLELVERNPLAMTNQNKTRSTPYLPQKKLQSKLRPFHRNFVCRSNVCALSLEVTHTTTVNAQGKPVQRPRPMSAVQRLRKKTQEERMKQQELEVRIDPDLSSSSSGHLCFAGTIGRRGTEKGNSSKRYDSSGRSNLITHSLHLN